jgi:hypothetical protein
MFIVTHFYETQFLPIASDLFAAFILYTLFYGTCIRFSPGTASARKITGSQSPDQRVRCPSLEMKSMCHRKGDKKTTKCYLNTQNNSEMEGTLSKLHSIWHVKCSIVWLTIKFTEPTVQWAPVITQRLGLSHLPSYTLTSILCPRQRTTAAIRSPPTPHSPWIALSLVNSAQKWFAYYFVDVIFLSLGRLIHVSTTRMFHFP